MQYAADVRTTIDYFANNGYSLFVQWLNPGHHDPGGRYFDELGLVNYLLAKEATVSIRDGKMKTKDRVQEIADYLYGWSKSRGLLLTI